MMRVLVDGRLAGHDGIARYGRCLTAALGSHADRLQVKVASPRGASRFSLSAGAELLRAAAAWHADVVHVLDYRIPLEAPGVPLVLTIHDVLLLDRPEHCYSDRAFAAHFGSEALVELRATTRALRRATAYPPGMPREPRSLHEEYYARMLALACARATCVVTPSETTAQRVASAVGPDVNIRVSPYGVDHMDAERLGLDGSVDGNRPDVGEPYLLYVGQACTHKRLEVLVEAFRRSRAASVGMRLACVGRDFTGGAYGARLLADRLGDTAVAVGDVTDLALARLYASAVGLVHLAEYEGFGFTPLEALAAGTRVVASDIPVLRETLGPEATFVDPTDPTDVAAGIHRLVSEPDDPTSRDRRRSWAGRYHWSQHARRVLELYDEAAHRPRPEGRRGSSTSATSSPSKKKRSSPPAGRS